MATPTKYEAYMPAKLVELCSEGRSMVQVAREFGISKDTIYDWAKDINKPEFMQAYKLGRTCFEAYWEEIGMKGAKGVLVKFNPMAWDRLMRTRCKDEWSESAISKIELKNELKSMTNKEIDETIKTLLAARQSNNQNNNSGSEAVV